ncbi:IclR family transcriptional regulator [Caballeronia hypogeia]|uniref:IclR family transcriptional regulator n=1 Tax=Caballeronia hypogeia TaxID=1777140 RepID=A0A158BWJ0_9BURK|nr:IclR family transcriptional regulator [Caballeronia hypogeia]SAK74453.1 IclR family transcriptional regulator [Caballeronia hypogeia]
MSKIAKLITGPMNESDAPIPIERDGAQSIDRAMNVLMLVSAHSRVGMPLREIVTQSGLKQPTVHRLLGALVRAGMVEQDPDSKRYHLGCESYVLGTLAAERFGIHSVAVGSVVRLANASEDTAFLTVRRGDYGVCVHREEGTYPVRAQVLSVGDRHPLGVGAGAIAILSALEDAEVEQVLAACEPSYREHYPAISSEKLRELVKETRERGYATHRGLVHPGSWGLGIVIRNEVGEPCAALSIGAIENRLGEDRQGKLVRLLQNEARAVEARLRQRIDERRTEAASGLSSTGRRSG